jgi:hypothetical protein
MVASATIHELLLFIFESVKLKKLKTGLFLCSG